MTNPSFHRNRGAALASALIVLVALTLIAVTAAYRSTLNELMSANQRDALNAMSIADSGLEAGFAEVKKNYSALPQALCDIANAGDYLVGNGSVSLSGGSYAVTVKPGIDCIAGDKAVLNSVGQVNGALRVVETLLEMGPGGGGSRHSVLTNAYLDISSSQKFVGPIISVHSNTGIKHGGAPITCTSFAACGTELNPPTGNMSTSGTFDPKTYELLNQAYPWELQEGVPEETIPHVYPPDWYQYATVELTADCKVLGGPASANPGQLIWNVATSGVWSGWSCSIGNIWEMKSASATLHSGFYYVRGNIKISASQDNPWVASFVTEGSIAVTCCMKFSPWAQTGNEVADNILMLAGNDIQFTGSPGFVNEGIIAAHMEIKLAGSGAYFKGTIIAENGRHGMGQEVTTNTQKIQNLSSLNTITADVVIEGTGLGLTLSGSQLKVAAWRELVQ